MAEGRAFYCLTKTFSLGHSPFAMTTSESFICIGIMSGTSLDGADAVAADFSSPVPVIRGRAHEPFSPELRAELLSLCAPGENEIERSGAASVKLAQCYAKAVESLLASSLTGRRSVTAPISISPSSSITPRSSRNSRGLMSSLISGARTSQPEARAHRSSRRFTPEPSARTPSG